MNCQHCYAKIIVGHPALDGSPVYVRQGVDPNRHTLADMVCTPGVLSVQHKLMPMIEDVEAKP